MAAKLEAVVEGQDEIKGIIHQSMEEIKQQLAASSTSIEQLRRTVVNLNVDQTPVPLMFVVQLEPTEDEEFARAVREQDTATLVRESFLVTSLADKIADLS